MYIVQYIYIYFNNIHFFYYLNGNLLNLNLKGFGFDKHFFKEDVRRYLLNPLSI